MDDKLMVGKEGKDPLTTGPDQVRVLFDRFGDAAHGFSHQEVASACMNIILNAIRQTYPTLRGADESLTRLLEQGRSQLGDHYFPGGKRRSVFPFHQKIDIPFLGKVDEQKRY